jgi:hypothetical protein
VAGRRAVPLLLLVATAACVLVALDVLPEVTLPADAGRPAAVIVNDTAGAVVVFRCGEPCATGRDPVALAPGRELRARPASAATWLIEDRDGGRIGCLVVSESGERLPVSRATRCPP